MKREVCGLWCGCYLPGLGDVGCRRCRLGHFDERDNSKKPLLNHQLEILQPFACKRKKVDKR